MKGHGRSGDTRKVIGIAAEVRGFSMLQDIEGLSGFHRRASFLGSTSMILNLSGSEYQGAGDRAPIIQAIMNIASLHVEYRDEANFWTYVDYY